MLHREEILILQQANEILQRHNLGGMLLQPQYLSQEISDHIFNHPEYGNRFHLSVLEYLCDFYEANPKYLENDQEFPPVIQLAFVPRNQSFHYLPAMNMEALIGESIEPFVYDTFDLPLTITFEESKLMWEIDGSFDEIAAIKGEWAKEDIINDRYPTTRDETSRKTLENIYGYDVLLSDLQKYLAIWLEKHPLVYQLIQKLP